MQIGIDLGATKIEYVLLDNNNVELKRDRIQTPKDYENTIISITEIIKKLENKSGKFNVGICHPGAVDKTTGLIKNAHNSQWLNDRNLIKDLKLKIYLCHPVQVIPIYFSSYSSIFPHIFFQKN